MKAEESGNYENRQAHENGDFSKILQSKQYNYTTP
jgi:hypothetical protein